MADKTIPSLPTISALDVNSLFIVDSGTETFKVNLANLALFIRESVLPAGITADYSAGPDAPAGWLLCDGSAISRVDYARLFAAIGTTYGTGNGTTTFNIPDARGRVTAGRDNMGGSTAGRITNAIAGIVGTTLGAAGGGEAYTPAGTMSGSQSIAHTHGVSVSNHSHTIAHVHQVMAVANTTSRELRFLTAANPATTSFTVSGTEAHGGFSGESASVGPTPPGDLLWNPSAPTVGARYSAGVVNAAAGSGSTAASGSAGAQSVTSAAMSTNATVNGSNFIFTGTAAHRVQPTLIVNKIIKT